MKNESRLQQRQDGELSQAQEAQSASQQYTYETPEEALRADRQEIQVPPGVAQRIASSIGTPPPTPTPSWWRRWFGRAS